MTAWLVQPPPEHRGDPRQPLAPFLLLRQLGKYVRAFCALLQPVINEFLARRGDKRNRGKKDAAAQRRRGSSAQLGLEDAPKFSGGAALKRHVWCCLNLHPSRRRLCPCTYPGVPAASPISPAHLEQDVGKTTGAWPFTFSRTRSPQKKPASQHRFCC